MSQETMHWLEWSLYVGEEMYVEEALSWAWWWLEGAI